METKTKYLGMELKSPIVVSASPLSEKIDNIKKMEDAGAAAIVLYSLFEEQLIAEEKSIHHFVSATQHVSAEADSFFPEPHDYQAGPNGYLEHIQNAKKSVKIPIIASLNGSHPGSWTEYSAMMQEAGADAIELNLYKIPTDLGNDGFNIEQEYLDIVKAVRASIKIPLAVKLSPYFSNMANMALKFKEAGADALVLFNSFYQPDIDLDNLEIEPKVSLSHSGSSRIAMRWIAILKGRVNVDFAATGGIHSGTDIIKMLMVGANVTMTASALLKNGIGHLKTMQKEMLDWMTAKEYESVEQMMGSMSQMNIPDPEAFERAQYMKAIMGYKA